MMTKFLAILPYLICLLPLALYLSVQCFKKFREKSKWLIIRNGILLLISSFLIATLFSWFFLLEAKPSKNWKKLVQTTNTAILFGFGYELDQDSMMLPGPANTDLYKQAIKYIEINKIHLIMQQGVMVAAHEDSIDHPFVIDSILMHPHNPKVYVNTLGAAKYALYKMDSLKVKRAVVYAHNMQLARAVYDLKRVAASDPRWHDMEFITPCIRSTPQVPKSEHLHTQSNFIFFLREIYLSRPIEAFYPLRCIKTP